VPIEETVAQYGADYFELPLSPGVNLEFSGTPAVPVVAGFLGATGEMLYGGRADSSVATLTRGFDLAGLSSAELSYRVWYDIERDYDFLYVSASSDDGNTWVLLDTPNMSRTNLSGNNLGVGYTGQSGAPIASWVRESIDLTQYAGKPILVRFSYVTDDSILREGVVIDDIAIEALGYAEPVQGQMGWQSEGWARIGGLLPQNWSLQVIEWIRGVPTVAQVNVDPSGHAVWAASGRELDRAVLVVSATTPVTLQRANYRLIVRDDEGGLAVGSAHSDR
jgi:hypothetical protein